MDQELPQFASPQSSLAELNNSTWDGVASLGILEEEVHHMVLTRFHTVLVCINVNIGKQHEIFLCLKPRW